VILLTLYFYHIFCCLRFVVALLHLYRLFLVKISKFLKGLISILKFIKDEGHQKAKENFLVILSSIKELYDFFILLLIFHRILCQTHLYSLIKAQNKILPLILTFVSFNMVMIVLAINLVSKHFCLFIIYLHLLILINHLSLINLEHLNGSF
jgi:hypothetical protein